MIEKFLVLEISVVIGEQERRSIRPWAIWAMIEKVLILEMSVVIG